MDVDFFGRFMPHGVCYMWDPAILWTNVISDSLIALAYFSIPGAILYFLRRRTDISLAVVGWLFAAFIVLCGTTHLVGIWTIWNGDYGVQGLVKAATAMVSVLTATSVWLLMPKALALPSNFTLQREVATATSSLRRANEELGGFVSAASHDLKEPLRTLQAYSELLEQDLADNDEQRIKQDLDFIQRASARMQRLVDSLVRLASTGKDAPQIVSVDLNELTDSVVISIAALIEETGATIDSANLPTLETDETLLRQIYQNLIVNAVRHRQLDQKPAIRLTAERGAAGQWVLGVADNGPGVPAEFRERIFAPFERLTVDHKNNHDIGVGIGLAICEKAVSRLGGKIWIEDIDSGGSHFRFTVAG
ncbi:MAG: hypothetical protein KJP03_04435 [Gammaproteobacteria bacterium]|nr:hypothetical protein [Gammaproteobacteria bacterium]